MRNGGGGNCTLYFLFGHLFHAVGDGMLGDEAVVKALTWSTGEFDYDAKAKLPADETVRGSIPELVAQAESKRAEARPQESPPAPPPAPAPEPRAYEAPSPPPPEEKPASAEAPPRREARPPDAEHREERRGVKHRPSPRHGREPIPVPAGQVIYDSLKTSFVDFPRLVTTLEREGYTGYVRLLTEEAAGLILFKDGAALECAFDAGDDPALTLGTEALVEFNDAVTNGQGILDVVSLTPELVDGLYQLTVAKPLYSDLYASWVDPDALLKFLEKRKLTGSVMVRAGGNTGVIILTEGKLTGAYTSDSRDIAENAEGVLKICDDRDAVIEVKSADNVAHKPLDVDAIVGSHKVPTGTTRVDMPVYRPQSAPPAAPPPPPAPPPAPAEASTQPSMPAFVPEPPPPPEPAWQPGVVSGPGPAGGAGPELPPPPVAVAPAGPSVDWEQIIADLQAVTEEDLGNRSRKVKDLLASADRSPAGLEATIDQIPSISILFVDSSRLESLANKLRARLHSHLG